METIKAVKINTAYDAKYIFCDNNTLLQWVIDDYTGDKNELLVELLKMARDHDLEIITEDDENFTDFCENMIVIKEI